MEIVEVRLVRLGQEQKIKAVFSLEHLGRGEISSESSLGHLGEGENSSESAFGQLG